ncbi:MAG: hypothetical protein FD183_1514, partial [Chitinophagaceae bacterium]
MSLEALILSDQNNVGRNDGVASVLCFVFKPKFKISSIIFIAATNNG